MSIGKTRAVCVLGMHRSGTSAIMRAINLLGVYLGDEADLVPAKSDNPEGFWEHAGIVDFHERLLHQLSHTWDATAPLPERWWERSEIAVFKRELVELLRENFLSHALWGWKDPRTCLVLPLWLEVCRELDVEISFVLPIRNPLDVAASLSKRNGFPTEKSLSIWNLYVHLSLQGSKGAMRALLQYDHFLEDWEGELQAVSNQLNLPWPKQLDGLRRQMGDFIKPSLRHSRITLEEAERANKLPLPVRDLYRLCLKADEQPLLLEQQEFQERLQDLYDEYEIYARLIGSAITQHAASYNILQAFWMQDGMYSEVHSQSLSLKQDEDFHDYELLLPVGGGPLRIDPVNFPAFLEIESIEIGVKEEAEYRSVFHSSAANGFAGLAVSTGMRVLSESAGLRFFAYHDDPQIHIRADEIDAEGLTMQMRIRMRVERRLSVGVADLLNQMLERTEQEKAEQRHRLEHAEKELQAISERIAILESDLRVARDQIQGKDQHIAELLVASENMNAQIGECTQKAERLSHSTVRLQKELAERDRQLVEILSTKSWRITLPLRWLMGVISKRTGGK